MTSTWGLPPLTPMSAQNITISQESKAPSQILAAEAIDLLNLGPFLRSFHLKDLLRALIKIGRILASRRNKPFYLFTVGKEEFPERHSLCAIAPAPPIFLPLIDRPRDGRGQLVPIGEKIHVIARHDDYVTFICPIMRTQSQITKHIKE